MEWLMFFFRPPLTTMVFQWFYHHWTITIECFWRVQPLVSMVFQWFLKFWGRWLTMVCMYHCTKKCVKSIRDKLQNHRNNIFHFNIYCMVSKCQHLLHFIMGTAVELMIQEETILQSGKEARRLMNSFPWAISRVWFATAMRGNEYQGRLAVAS